MVFRQAQKNEPSEAGKEKIREMQDLLNSYILRNNLGQALEPDIKNGGLLVTDGVIGPNTKFVIGKVQEKLGLPNTEVIDKKTIAIIEETLEKKEWKEFWDAFNSYLRRNGGDGLIKNVKLHLLYNQERIKELFFFFNSYQMKNGGLRFKGSLNNKYIGRKYSARGNEREILQAIITSFTVEYLTGGYMNARLCLALGGQESEWQNITYTASKGIWQITTNSSITELEKGYQRKKVENMLARCNRLKELNRPVTKENDNWKGNIFMNGMAMMETIALKILANNYEDGFEALSNRKKLKNILSLYNGNAMKHPKTGLRIQDMFPRQCLALYDFLNESQNLYYAMVKMDGEPIDFYGK